MQESVAAGMTLTEFYGATDREIYNFIIGHSKNVDQVWNYVRHIMLASFIPWTEKGVELKPGQIISIPSIDKEHNLTPFEKQQEELKKEALKEWGRKLDEIPIVL